MKWFLKCLNQYADFDGRARRKEYWMFVLWECIFVFVLTFLDILLGLTIAGSKIGVLGSVFSLAIFIPSLAVSIRRLHDIGKSGWYYLLYFVPLIGGILLFIWSCTEGEEGPNKWGEDPKAEIF